MYNTDIQGSDSDNSELFNRYPYIKATFDSRTDNSHLIKKYPELKEAVDECLDASGINFSEDEKEKQYKFAYNQAQRESRYFDNDLKKAVDFVIRGYNYNTNERKKQELNEDLV